MLSSFLTRFFAGVGPSSTPKANHQPYVDVELQLASVDGFSKLIKVVSFERIVTG
jgi:hypothetical protein